MSNYDFHYKPILLSSEQRYRLQLPSGSTPTRWWTSTHPMNAWMGEVTSVLPGQSSALTWHKGKIVHIDGKSGGPLKEGGPCYIMEHLQIDGHMKYLICPENIQDGNKNFVNFGILNGIHLRIDIYTGESVVIDA